MNDDCMDYGESKKRILLRILKKNTNSKFKR